MPDGPAPIIREKSSLATFSITVHYPLQFPLHARPPTFGLSLVFEFALETDAERGGANRHAQLLGTRKVSRHPWGNIACQRCLFRHCESDAAEFIATWATAHRTTRVQLAEELRTEEDVQAAPSDKWPRLRERVGRPICSSETRLRGEVTRVGRTVFIVVLRRVAVVTQTFQPLKKVPAG